MSLWKKSRTTDINMLIHRYFQSGIFKAPEIKSNNKRPGLFCTCKSNLGLTILGILLLFLTTKLNYCISMVFFLQERINRRMSTSFLQHILVKQHNEKDDTESPGSSERGSLAELTASATSLNPLIPPSRDHCVTIAHLLHYIHALVVSIWSVISANFHMRNTGIAEKLSIITRSAKSFARKPVVSQDSSCFLVSTCSLWLRFIQKT